MNEAVGATSSVPKRPKRPGRTAGPCGTAVKSVPSRVSKDARAKRPNLSKTAVLGVDGRALQSLVKWVLPVVICRARPSSAGPGRHQHFASIIDDVRSCIRKLV